MATERFTKDHEWIRVEDGIGTVGITEHAQEPARRYRVRGSARGRPQGGKQGDAVAVVESVKAASDVFAPVSGEVVEVNGEIATPAGARQRGRARARLGSSR